MSRHTVLSMLREERLKPEGIITIPTIYIYVMIIMVMTTTAKITITMKWHQVLCGGISRVRAAVFTLRALDQVSHPPMQHEAGVIGHANPLKLLNGVACADGGQRGIVGGQGEGSGSQCDG